MIADRASQFIDKSALTKGNTKEVEHNSAAEKKQADRQCVYTYATQTQKNENEVKLNDNTNKRRTTLTQYTHTRSKQKWIDACFFFLFAFYQKAFSHFRNERHS